MAIDLKFSKSDTSSNWGFRVVGGADFQQPLIVVKVNENSLAEQAGLKVGDIIVKVNDKCTSTLTHAEVQQSIILAGLQFNLGIKRGEFVPPELLQDEGREIEVLMRDVQIAVDEDIIETAEELVEQLGKEIFTEFGQHKRTKVTNDKSNKKMVFSNSTQTYFATEDKYKQKKWSTFLMKPDRPMPKSKKIVEEEKINKENAYKIVITKQYRRKFLPTEKKVQFDKNILEIDISSEENPYSPEVKSPELDSLGSQQELDSLEELVGENKAINHDHYYDVDENEEGEGEKEEIISAIDFDYECNKNNEFNNENNFERIRKDSLGMKFRPISEIIVDPNSETAMTLEDQLREVQKQLQTLSQLPSAVQVTLDAVSKQLAEIVSVKENSANENNKNDDNEDEIYNVDEATASIEKAEAESGADTNSIVVDDLDDDSITEEELQAIMQRSLMEEVEEEEEEEKEDEHKEDVEDIDTINQEELEAQRKEELRAKTEKEMEDRRKATFRPIVLPGGRKWIDPDDVVPTRKPKMTDAKIMESIDSSLEVISGKRKGINFMKYTPPTKKLDHLQRSEVYRLIHGMEPPTRGIVTRPEKILPEQDYYEASRENP